MEVREVNFKYLFVYFSSLEIFWGLQLAINSLTFTAKAQNEQGILLFVHWKLAQGLSNKRFDLYESYIFQVRFVSLQRVILCQLAHQLCHPSHSTKTKGQRVNYTKTKHCMSLIGLVINYAHKVCCQHVITFVPRIAMEGRMCSQVGEQNNITRDMCFLGKRNTFHQGYVFHGQWNTYHQGYLFPGQGNTHHKGYVFPRQGTTYHQGYVFPGQELCHCVMILYHFEI